LLIGINFPKLIVKQLIFKNLIHGSLILPMNKQILKLGDNLLEIRSQLMLVNYFTYFIFILDGGRSSGI